MNHLYKLPLFVLLFAVSCRKNELPENYSLAGQPLHIVQKATIGNFKVLASSGGFVGFPIKYDSFYVRITADTVIWNNRGAIQYFLYKWKKTNYHDQSYYGMSDFYLPERVEKDHLTLLVLTSDIIGYDLQRIP